MQPASALKPRMQEAQARGELETDEALIWGYVVGKLL